MTRPDDPPPPTEIKPSALVLPRPNLGPEPWSEVVPIRGWGELVLGLILGVVMIGLVIRHRRARTRARSLAQLDIEPGPAEIQTPSHRLIASSAAVRLTLIAEFGPTWSSRTTEEIALDPNLTDRLGRENAARIIAYLQRVDRAKFAEEEFDDVDEWIDAARESLNELGRPPVRRPTRAS